MSATAKLLKPPPQEDVYSDDVLYGDRRKATKQIEFAKANNNPDCIVRTSKDTIVDKTKQWNIKHIIGLDKRLKTLAQELDVAHALPIQRFCWPQIHHSAFPFVCIAPKSSGKTFTHLFYIVTQCISDIPMVKTNEILSNIEQSGTFVCQPGQSSSSAMDMSKANLDALDIDEPENGCPANGQPSATGDDAQPAQDGGSENTGWTNLQSYDINPDDFIEHPKYIIICSSQNHVETLGREIDRMKSATFGSMIFHERRNQLPPKVAIIHVHQNDEKLAIKFNACEVLITTPGALFKCVQLDLLDFSRCRRVFFDDIDLSLQLHNSSIREIFKLYVVQMHDVDQQEAATQNGYGNKEALPTCKIHMFSRKWTDLLKQSISTVFRQHFLIFGSIAEASIYGNLRYDLECVSSPDLAFAKLRALVERYECSRKPNDIMAITCETNAQARLILSKLDNTDLNKAVILETDSILALKLAGRSHKGPVYIISDSALEFTIVDLNCVTHLVHFTIPEELIVYDQRFRLMYRYLISTDSIEMVTTVFIRPKTSNEFLKELYDVLSRSSTTLRSTKLELRDLISEKSNKICWRWASTGLCRLEKLSKDDRFGSFCPDRHSILPVDLYPLDERWPKSGQVRLTVTHLVNPNEFYFWFEAHRDKDSPMKKWTKFESCGSEFMHWLQIKLNKFKDTPDRSIPLESFNQNQVYGVYFHQEARVDRVVLLEKPRSDHVDPLKALGKGYETIPLQFRLRYEVEYSKQVEALKVDYGTRVSVYLRNIFPLPDSLASIERQCFRGFCLGVKPTDNEPDWLYKAKKNFYELVCVDHLQDVTAWMRLQSGRCFWFDNMVVSRELPEIGTKATYKTFPHDELIKKGLALKCTTEPSCLPPSDRLETICKWKIDDAAKYASWAFLRKDKAFHDIYVLHAIGKRRLELKVRLADYNKSLMDLETMIREDYERNQLQNLEYFAVGAICVARFCIGSQPETGEPFYEYNRCRISEILSPQINSNQDPDSVDDTGAKLDNSKYIVDCLDHGDLLTVTKRDLFVAKMDYLRKLPFQAITCYLADLNPSIYEDANLVHRIKELIYQVTRIETLNDQMRIVKCKFSQEQTTNEVYLYVPHDGSDRMHIPLICSFEQRDMPIFTNDDPELRKFIEFESPIDVDSEEQESPSEFIMRSLITDILDDIILKQLNYKLGEETHLEENENEDDGGSLVTELSNISIG